MGLSGGKRIVNYLIIMMDFGKPKFLISCLTAFHVQLKCDQSLHTCNMLRHSACSLAVTEARFSFMDTENKTKHPRENG